MCCTNEGQGQAAEAQGEVKRRVLERNGLPALPQHTSDSQPGCAALLLALKGCAPALAALNRHHLALAHPPACAHQTHTATDIAGM